MNILSDTFFSLDHQEECFMLTTDTVLNGTVSEMIRDLVGDFTNNSFPALYFDASNVIEIDLCGINEVIHSHYVVKQYNKKLIFAYKAESPVQKWVNTTRLDKFIETAIITE